MTETTEGNNMQDEIEEKWGYASIASHFVILPESVINEIAPLHDLKGCATWGAVADLGQDVLDLVLELTGYGSFEEYTAHLNITGAVPVPGAEGIMAENYDPDAEAPSRDDPFEMDQIPSFGDGDFPPNPFILMTENVPDDVRSLYGDGYETIFNGYITEFDVKSEQDVLAWFVKEGFTVEPSEVLAGILRGIWYG